VLFILLYVFDSLFKTHCRAETLAGHDLFTITGSEVFENSYLFAPRALLNLLPRILGRWRCVCNMHT